MVGSSIVSEFKTKEGKSELVRMAKVDFINDKAGKPVDIYEHIGIRSILAFGNSDSDMQMIEYTKAGEGRRLGLFVYQRGTATCCTAYSPNRPPMATAFDGLIQQYIRVTVLYCEPLTMSLGCIPRHSRVLLAGIYTTHVGFPIKDFGNDMQGAMRMTETYG